MIIQCYLCGAKRLNLVRDRLRYNIKGKVWQCPRCGLVFSPPFDSEEFYEKDYRKKYSPILGKAATPAQIFNQYRPFQSERLKSFKKFISKKDNILEIGCSAGHFLDEIRKHVRSVKGIEFNKKDAKWVNDKLGIKAFTRPIEKTGIKKGSLDGIFVLETLEHIEDPLKFLTGLKPYLSRRGKIFIEIPNINEARVSLFDIPSFHLFYFRKPHFFYFSEKTFRKLAEKCGLRLLASGYYQLYSLSAHLELTYGSGLSADANSAMKPSEFRFAKKFTPKYGAKKEISFEMDKNKSRRVLNDFYAAADKKYRELLCKNKLSDSMFFVLSAEFLQNKPG